MKYKILYVDDERANLSSFNALLRREYEVFLAEGGAEALEILAKEKIDLIISDQRMPLMTGVELLAQVKAKYPDIIRMVLTGYSDMQAIVDAINKGNIYYYIAKPWKGDELKLILSKALEAYTLREKNKDLEKKNVLAQFEILKNQINPHFLFNCINVLSSLIKNDTENALLFTNKFAKLYRSILQLREHLIISLEEELEFVEAFVELQRIRFKSKIQIDFNILDRHQSSSLPPFSLQLLLENVFKHNIISADKPMLIEIFSTEEDELCVCNIFQPRAVAEESTGIGLSNLKERYALITDKTMTVTQDEHYFTVKLPLIPEA